MEPEQQRVPSSDAGSLADEDSFPGGRVEDNGLSFKVVFTTLGLTSLSVDRPGRAERFSRHLLSLADRVLAS